MNDETIGPVILTPEQEACLRYTGEKTLLVKGIAGAGKSLVLQALAKKLAAAYPPGEKTAGKVAILTFSSTLNLVTKELLAGESEADSRITVLTLNTCLANVCRDMDPSFLGRYPGTQYDGARMDAMQAALEKYQTFFGPHRLLNLELKFWLDEIDWMKDRNVSKEDREYYLGLSRKGRGKQVHMSRTDREAAFHIYCLYEEQKQMRKLRDWADDALYLVRNGKQIPEEDKFDHVLIDEAQDLSLVQMMAAMMLFRRDMVIAMDMNQRIFNRQWTPKLLGIETTTKMLTKPMRTTRQIDCLAESVRRNNDQIGDRLELSEQTSAPRAVSDREGPLPKVVHLEDTIAEKAYVTGQIAAWRKLAENATIGVIAARNVQLRTYSVWMSEAGIAHEIIGRDSTFSVTRPGVKLVNAFQAKGLEFTYVIIPQLEEGNFPYYCTEEDEAERRLFYARCRNLLYVAMTRARFTLVMTYSGEHGSRFLREMDRKFYSAAGKQESEAGGTLSGVSVGRADREQKPVPFASPKRTGTGFLQWRETGTLQGESENAYEKTLALARQRREESRKQALEQERARMAALQAARDAKLRQEQEARQALEAAWEAKRKEQELQQRQAMEAEQEAKKAAEQEARRREQELLRKQVQEADPALKPASREPMQERTASGAAQRPEMKGIRKTPQTAGAKAGMKSEKIPRSLFCALRRTILFRIENLNMKEGTEDMIEELYRQVSDRKTDEPRPESIVPATVRQTIRNGILPAFPESASGQLKLLPEEIIHYFDHAVFYQKKSDENGRFDPYPGVLYLTDRRIVFCGKKRIDIPYKRLERVTAYDRIPEFLEMQGGERTSYFQLPDADMAYRVLRMIANKEQGTPNSQEKVPFSYEELAEKADIGTCIFVLQRELSGEMPEELQGEIRKLIQSLRGFQKTLDRYPEEKEAAEQFLSYYIPETVRVVNSWQSCQGVGLDESTIQKMYQKVLAAVKALGSAAAKKIADIYRDQVTDTVARAEAVRELLGQDGYISFVRAHEKRRE